MELCPFIFQDEMKQLAKNERFAVNVSNLANLVLFVAKVYASVESRSLAVIASTLDSLLDLLSGFILWFTAYAMKTPNQYHYPIGKKRMQPVVCAAPPQFPSFLYTCVSNTLSFKHFSILTKILQMQGIIVFASVMATLGLQVLFESVRQLITKVCFSLLRILL